MTDLYPTKTRLALLRAIGAGEVRRGHDLRDRDHTSGRVVDMRVKELCRAGWCRFGPSPGTTWGAWSLTEAGQAVVDGAS